MFTIYLITTFILKAVFIFSAFLLSNHLFKNTKIALLATFMLSFTHFMGPEQIGVVVLLPSPIVFSFIPLIIYLFLKINKKFFPIIFAILACLAYVHPYHIAPMVLIFSFSLVFKYKNIKLLALCLIVFTILITPYMMNLYEIFIVGNLNPNIREYISEWAFFPGTLITTSKYSLVVAIGLFVAMKKNKEIFYWMLILFCYSMISIFGIVNYKIIAMNFYRVFKNVIFFSFILSSYFLVKLWYKTKIGTIILGILIFLPFSSLFYSNMLAGITRPVNMRVVKIDDVVKIANWMDENTTTNSLFLIPPDWGVLRTWSKRSAVFSFDYAPILTKYIDEYDEMRRDVVGVYNQTSTQEFTRIARKYSANYIVTFDQVLNLTKEVEINEFRIYKI